ncbi:MAG: hypothetical protein IEMM0006_1454 [bacterium]|nr:MAG: hypothetical protein IEMM0006_1454 [bacterium]
MSLCKAKNAFFSLAPFIRIFFGPVSEEEKHLDSADYSHRRQDHSTG